MATGRPPFIGPEAAALIGKILREEPTRPSNLNPSLSSGMEEIVLRCIRKDPTLRYASAEDVLRDLHRLELGRSRRTARRQRLINRLMVLVAVLLIAIGIGIAWRMLKPVRSPHGQISVAVLPFQSDVLDNPDDFLRIALTDQLADILSYAPAVAVRPTALTRKYYSSGDIDPQAIGRELRVSKIVAGRFAHRGEALHLNLELVDVETNQIAWRDSFDIYEKNTVELDKRINSAIRGGLLHALGVEAVAAQTRPSNAQAFDFFLRSKSVGSDPIPNEEGISLLERAIALDGDYAPSWAELAVRRFYVFQWGESGFHPCGEGSRESIGTRP
jgi:eukaryotic-like serine/threonine-protein kinase